LRRFLDLGFCFTFEIEDLFFFFCNSRPMVAVHKIREGDGNW
jgi:hypothetical protein